MIKKNLFSYSLLGLIALVPFSPEKAIYGAWVTFSDVFILLVVIAFITSLCTRKERINTGPFPLLPIVGFMLIAFVLSAVNAINKYYVFKETIKYLLLFILFYVIVFKGNKKVFVNGIPYVISISAAVVSVWFFVDFYLGKVDLPLYGRVWHRSMLPEQHLNSLGAFLAISIPFSFYLFIESTKKSTRAYAVIAVLSQLAAIYLTYSRANWIALAAALTLYFIIRYKFIGFLRAAVLVIAPFVIFTVIFPHLNLGDRFLSIFDSNEGSIISRKEHMAAAVKLIKMEPFIGVGLSNFQVASKKYFNIDLTEIAHNIFLNFGAETGIPSMLLLLLLIGVFYCNSITIYSSISDPSQRHLIITVMVSFTGLLISAQFGDMFSRGIKEYFALLLALPYAIKNLKI